nr:diaminopimelate decarboxylase [Candidatus Bathyarchaeota archaeon]
MKKDELRELALRHGTPLFIYDGRRISANFRKLVCHIKRICEKPKILYAVKANPSPQVLLKMSKLGCGADVMSVGE